MDRQMLPLAHEYHQNFCSIPNIGGLKLFDAGKFGLGTIVA